jgi:hypothetical protein
MHHTFRKMTNDKELPVKLFVILSIGPHRTLAMIDAANMLANDMTLYTGTANFQSGQNEHQRLTGHVHRRASQHPACLLQRLQQDP